MNAAADKRPMLFVLVSFILFVLLLMLPINTLFQAFWGEISDPQTEIVLKIVKRVIAAAVFLAYLFGTGSTTLLRRPVGSVAFPAFTGALLLSSNLSAVFFDLQAWRIWGTAPFTVALTAANCLAVALFEELAFRGAILTLLLKRFGGSRRGAVAAVALSSALFGLVHLVNLAGSPDLTVETLLQPLYTAAIGMVLAVVVLRTGSIWYAVLLHALFNFIGDLPLLLPAGLGANEAVASILDIWSVAVYLPLLLLCGIALIKSMTAAAYTL